MPEQLSVAGGSGPAPHLLRWNQGAAHLAHDTWTLVRDPDQWDGQPGAILPLAAFEKDAARLLAAGRCGLWLAPDEDPASAEAYFAGIALVGVDFPKFTDGRGYSTAYLVRTRLGWTGELRALGDVLPDQLHAMRRVGFDSFSLRAGQDPQFALGAFTPFAQPYQGSVDDPRPAFRRAT
jgi:uncharacterized protein (DUF934 family)